MRVGRRWIRAGNESCVAFLTNRKRSIGFWSVCRYILTSGVRDIPSSGAKEDLKIELSLSGARTLLTNSRHGNPEFSLGYLFPVPVRFLFPVAFLYPG